MSYFSFQWHITDECDQRCKHCYIFSENENHEPEYMGWNEIKKVFANCLDFCKKFDRTPYFYITGGDPVLHKYFWNLLELLKRHKIEFAILGNPFHIDDSTCVELKNFGCEKYQLSLDGMRETHDWFRKKGSFDYTLSRISSIKNAGICSVIMTTVSRFNINEIPEIIDTVVSYGADVYSFARYCPTGKDKSVGILPNEYRKLLEACDKKFREHESRGCSTYFDKKDHLWTLYEYETGTFKIPENAIPGVIYKGCHCGNSHLTILPNGDVYACRRVQNSRVGNAFKDSLVDLWLNDMERYREYKDFVKCSRCGLLSWCRGCPAVASGTNDGNFYSPDPQCWKEI